MAGFKRTSTGMVVRFDETEVSLLRHLVGEVRDLLADGTADPAAVGLAGLGDLVDSDADPEKPTDPVLARLLPDGYRADDEAAGEFRRLTEAGLRREKVETADALLGDLPPDGGGEVAFDAEVADRWLIGLNDVRLALGTRLNVSEDMPEPDPDDPDTPAYVVYLWLSELQEGLVEIAARAR